MKADAYYDIVALTSMGLRLTPKDNQPVHITKDYTMQVTSAESNVLTLPASLGCKTKVLTAFIKDSPISYMIKQDLSRRHIEYDGPHVKKGGPWGYRHQINIAGSGFGYRKPVVTNDRTGEVATLLSVDQFDTKQLFEHNGVKILHVSGLFAAISSSTLQFTLDMIQIAKEQGTLISFDINYRESFWLDREEELKRGFQSIMNHVDIVFGNEEDYQLGLGIKGPKHPSNMAEQLNEYSSLLQRVQETYPHIEVCNITLREVLHAKEHLWGAVSYQDNHVISIEPEMVSVLDRIGGGDGYAAGFLYGLLTNKSQEECTQFAWAAGAYTLTLWNDYAEPIQEDDIWQVWLKNARVQR